ncbi:urease accessory protein UreE [Amaricoccus solimangrovi]|uniref:Urease accessory protein UreE n=1 Tax=Amaricoccus solimangrovi TaxID=2589815 RepID=A0A501WXY0_9RHOB|nr:urease accessory protein UreE [Amaricoccus solimangrovi]TPE53105.1 urease accessory protein UreE [Amaricoccus solimangrovi]
MTRQITRRVERGLGPLPDADRVTLDYEGRFLRRRTLATASGASLLVDLAETVSLEAGDAFVTEDGARIAIEAAAEPLVEVRTVPGGLARLAWHIGNRHTPAEIAADHLLIRRDHVLEAMLTRLGARLTPVLAPFRPEGGAYGTGRTHGHHHGGATDDPRGTGHGPRAHA